MYYQNASYAGLSTASLQNLCKTKWLPKLALRSFKHENLSCYCFQSDLLFLIYTFCPQQLIQGQRQGSLKCHSDKEKSVVHLSVGLYNIIHSVVLPYLQPDITIVLSHLSYKDFVIWLIQFVARDNTKLSISLTIMHSNSVHTWHTIYFPNQSYLPKTWLWLPSGTVNRLSWRHGLFEMKRGLVKKAPKLLTNVSAQILHKPVTLVAVASFHQNLALIPKMLRHKVYCKHLYFCCNSSFNAPGANQN